MTKAPADDQDEKPLDPALERVRRRMMRLQIVSVVIMVVSLMAVFGAVVYKTTHSAPPEAASKAALVPSEGPVNTRALLPQGFSVQSVAMSGNRVLFYGQTADGLRQALVFDYDLQRIVATISLPAS